MQLDEYQIPDENQHPLQGSISKGNPETTTGDLDWQKTHYVEMLNKVVTSNKLENKKIHESYQKELKKLQEMYSESHNKNLEYEQYYARELHHAQETLSYEKKSKINEINILKKTMDLEQSQHATQIKYLQEQNDAQYREMEHNNKLLEQQVTRLKKHIESVESRKMNEIAQIIRDQDEREASQRAGIEQVVKEKNSLKVELQNMSQVNHKLRDNLHRTLEIKNELEQKLATKNINHEKSISSLHNQLESIKEDFKKQHQEVLNKVKAEHQQESLTYIEQINAIKSKIQLILDHIKNPTNQEPLRESLLHILDSINEELDNKDTV